MDNIIVSLAIWLLKNYLRLTTLGWHKIHRKRGLLTPDEVNEHYAQIVDIYEKRHHRITNSRDIAWRRQAGYLAISTLKAENEKGMLPQMLDICTGIGLSIEEIFKVFRYEGIRVKAYGLDYNRQMLDYANRKILPRMRESGLIEDGKREIEFIFGDATNFIGMTVGSSFKFAENSIDCVTNICGIGGIKNYILSFEQQLKVLKPGGIVIMIDMHRPISDFDNPWPFFPVRMQRKLSERIWDEIIVNHVLKDLWAWRDITPSFSALPLVAYHDHKENKYYGFEEIMHEVNTEAWDFKLPVITTAKVMVKKIEIDRIQYDKKLTALQTIICIRH